MTFNHLLVFQVMKDILNEVKGSKLSIIGSFVTSGDKRLKVVKRRVVMMIPIVVIAVVVIGTGGEEEHRRNYYDYDSRYDSLLIVN